MSNLIEVSDSGRTRVVRFIRPEIRNPLSGSVLDELRTILAEIQRSNGVDAVVFAGSGNSFASGADLREIAGVTQDSAKAFAERGQTLMNSIASLRVRSIAAINGFCFGGALDLVLSCSGRIASPSATFAHPGAGLGIITGWSGTQRLPRLIGRANALELFFTAEPIDAARAFEIGMIDAIADDPLAAALEYLDK